MAAQASEELPLRASSATSATATTRPWSSWSGKTRSSTVSSLSRALRPGHGSPGATFQVQEHAPGLYEVCTGTTSVRAGPKRTSHSLGVLKGGHRFYGIPYDVDGYSWLKVQTEDISPPVFSSKGLARDLEEDEPPANRMYNQSIRPLHSSAPDLHKASDLWVRNEDKFINCIRPGRSDRKWQEHQGQDLQNSEEWQAIMENRMQRQMTAGKRMAPNIVKPLSPLNKKDWSIQCNGAWTNYRQYGVYHSPPNDNIGRWRQLPEKDYNEYFKAS
eukprot:TRINITY_DN76336_c0_g1_i1.p1 TRINITY_DN76336_c0_g1~~TRINITY_DN76336_c0_g1_i1.p1  ORF type:complete len:282 (+),score=38.21 TRINITY_DN76336_c0_g1_i1:29-847(+)